MNVFINNSMETIDIIKYKVCFFKSTEELADKVYNLLEKEDFSTSNKLNSITKSNSDWYDSELINWFYECLNQVHTYLNIVDTLKLEIIGCWGNKTQKIQAHHIHHHFNSFLSGVYYPHDSDTELIFRTKNLWFEKFDQLKICKTSTNLGEDKFQGNYESSKYKPTKGALIIFPSHLYHKVATITDNSVRYSIAFNVFFSGKIGDNTSTQLELKPVTIRDRVTDTLP